MAMKKKSMLGAKKKAPMGKTETPQMTKPAKYETSSRSRNKS